jgi:hypothetical protein
LLPYSLPQIKRGYNENQEMRRFMGKPYKSMNESGYKQVNYPAKSMTGDLNKQQIEQMLEENPEFIRPTIYKGRSMKNFKLKYGGRVGPGTKYHSLAKPTVDMNIINNMLPNSGGIPISKNNVPVVNPGVDKYQLHIDKDYRYDPSIGSIWTVPESVSDFTSEDLNTWATYYPPNPAWGLEGGYELGKNNHLLDNSPSTRQNQVDFVRKYSNNNTDLINNISSYVGNRAEYQAKPHTAFKLVHIYKPQSITYKGYQEHKPVIKALGGPINKEYDYKKRSKFVKNPKKISDNIYVNLESGSDFIDPSLFPSYRQYKLNNLENMKFLNNQGFSTWEEYYKEYPDEGTWNMKNNISGEIMKFGGDTSKYRFEEGGNVGLSKFGSFLKGLAPVAGFIPGVGPIVSSGLGVTGGIMETAGKEGKKSFGDYALGAVNGGVPSLISGISVNSYNPSKPTPSSPEDLGKERKSPQLAYGGNPYPMDYEAEGNEVIQHNSETPMMGNGSLNRLNSNTSTINGPSHNAGGVDMSGGDRIYSDKIKVPGYKQTFAAKAKRLAKKIGDLEKGDDISKRTAKLLQPKMDELYETQENFKKMIEIKDFNKGLMKYGGSIKIKPSQEGSFTKWANRHNMSVQEAASVVMANKENYNSSIIKKANFAKNASKWNHKYGGHIADEELEGFDYSGKIKFDGGGEPPIGVYDPNFQGVLGAPDPNFSAINFMKARDPLNQSQFPQQPSDVFVPEKMTNVPISLSNPQPSWVDYYTQLKNKFTNNIANNNLNNIEVPSTPSATLTEGTYNPYESAKTEFLMSQQPTTWHTPLLPIGSNNTSSPQQQIGMGIDAVSSQNDPDLQGQSGTNPSVQPEVDNTRLTDTTNIRNNYNSPNNPWYYNAAAYAPAIYNTGMGLASLLSKKDYYKRVNNTQRAKALAEIDASKNYDISDQLNANRSGMYAGMKAARTASGGHGGNYMNYVNSVLRGKQVGDANAYAARNRFMSDANARAAQLRYNIGETERGEDRNVQTNRMMTDAKRRELMNTYFSNAATNLSDITQTNRYMGNMKDMNKYRLAWLKATYPEFAKYNIEIP